MFSIHNSLLHSILLAFWHSSNDFISTAGSNYFDFYGQYNGNIKIKLYWNKKICFQRILTHTMWTHSCHMMRWGTDRTRFALPRCWLSVSSNWPYVQHLCCAVESTDSIPSHLIYLYNANSIVTTTQNTKYKTKFRYR